MQHALRITWYDVPDAGRDAHPPWLHSSGIPALLARPRYLWAAHFATRTG